MEEAVEKFKEITAAHELLTKDNDGEDNDFDVNCHYCERLVGFSRTVTCQNKHFNFD
jgi:hypothetical protein